MKRTAALVLALATLPLAGCLGGDDAAEGPATATQEGAPGATDPSLAPANLTDGNGTATSPDDLTGGHAPHIHDYWGDTDRVTLHDGPLTVRLLSSGTFYNAFLRKDPALGGRFWELPDGATVYEGTGKMEVTASWTSPTITGLAFSYKPANKAPGWMSYSEPQPLANGQPFVLDVAPAMTDMPHEAVSRWGFYFTASGTPAMAEGEFTLKVDIVRMRDVTVFPGHPDTYEDTDRYVLADKDFTYKRESFVKQIADFATGNYQYDAIVPDEPVPMETRVLLVEITLTSATTVPVAKQQGLDLIYRTAGGEWDYIDPISVEGDKYTFGIPVEDSDVDSPYGEGSAWELHPYLDTGTDAPLLEDFGCGGCFDTELQGHVVVTAYDEDPTGKVQVDEEDDG